jgi:hypothetical protein
MNFGNLGGKGGDREWPSLFISPVIERPVRASNSLQRRRSWMLLTRYSPAKTISALGQFRSFSAKPELVFGVTAAV